MKQLYLNIKKSILESDLDVPDNLIPLKEACDNYIEYIQSEDYHEDGVDDYDVAIAEAALELIYGSDIFDRINEII